MPYDYALLDRCCRWRHYATPLATDAASCWLSVAELRYYAIAAGAIRQVVTCRCYGDATAHDDDSYYYRGC